MTTAQGIKPEAARLLLRAEARTGKADKAGAMKALEPIALNNLA
jgi:hypothetical protein